MLGVSRTTLIMPAAIALVAASAVILLWQMLRHDHERRVANVAEATSYATRSELARRLAAELQSLQRLAEFWASGTAEAPNPSGDTPLESVRLEGVDAIAWSGNDGQRFLAGRANPTLGHVPTAQEWAPLAPLIGAAPKAATPSAVGPRLDADGHALFDYYIPVAGPQGAGTMLAVIDAHDLLKALLVDESLGYAIRVTCCNGRELYRRGVADSELPGAWTRDGWITPAPGIRWNVTSRPSPDLADNLSTAAVDSVLVVGLALALLLGGLVFETRRANERAVAASSAERRVRKLNRELEDRVVARTQKLNDVLTDMHTVNLSVSHDLRSPLNALGLSIGQVREAHGGDRATAERCERMTSSVQRMAGIVERLLDYSRSDVDTDLEEVDMRALTERILAEHALPPGSATIGDLPSVRADPVITPILLGNLIGNAVKHAGAQRRLRIEVGSYESPQGETVYFVRDNGPGLDPGLANRLFKPVTKRRQDSESDGLGLGLAIAARAVERHGGWIDVQSEPNGGTTFRFTLRPKTGAAAE
jgi:signal transduction histidine kinase